MSEQRASERLREDALAAWKAGLRAVDPERAVAGAAQALFAEIDPSPTLVVATGKAAASMVRGLGRPVSGFALVAEGVAAADLPDTVEVLTGGHPLPTSQGLRASRRILDAVGRLGAGDTLLYLVSGGSSALFEVPRPGLADDELIEAYRVLLGAGAPIGEMNLVRTRLSLVKGGGLARAAYPARVVTVSVSDVIGDDPATIGSGPSVPADPSASDAALVLDRHALADALPPSAVEILLGEGSSSAGPSLIAGYRIVASASLAAEGARENLLAAGYSLYPAGDLALEGDAETLGRSLARRVEEMLEAGDASALVLAGETTVRIPADAGDGGRNQHLAASLALGTAGQSGFACVVGGTDGCDGSSAAAGAAIDGRSVARSERAGYPLERALAAFDTGRAFAASADAILTGPTGTNVGDLFVAVVRPDRAIADS